MIYLGPMNKKLAIAKAISHGQVCDDLPSYVLPAKVAIVQQEMLTCVLR